MNNPGGYIPGQWYDSMGFEDMLEVDMGKIIQAQAVGKKLRKLSLSGQFMSPRVPKSVFPNKDPDVNGMLPYLDPLQPVWSPMLTIQDNTTNHRSAKSLRHRTRCLFEPSGLRQSGRHPNPVILLP